MKAPRRSTSFRVAASLGFVLAGVWGCADSVEAPVETGEVASPMPICNEGSTAPICNPGCKPRCSGKACGADNGCGEPCNTGTCRTPGDTCGGAGVPAQCGNPGVDLRPYQTGFRNQGGRDTCTVFATVAAVEAAYKHKYGLNLDLSEQYLHHMQKSYWLDPTAQLPTPDIQPESNGGGNVPWQFTTLGFYGLPPESTLPYIGDVAWQNIGAWTSPSGPLIQTNQRALDDFMLSPAPVTYYTPTPITAAVLPQTALEGARYRPTSVKSASYADLTNLAWYKAELAAGREIAFDFALSSPDPSNNGIWDPGSTFVANHAMLIVGYNDVKQAFYVKNQWGTGAFDLFAYSWITGGAVYSATTVLDVADPYTAFGAAQNPQLTLGRWNLDYDGWRGTLDIYRLATPGGRRVGTYFGPDGVARRVNGYITGNTFDFYIDLANPNQPVTALSGMHFRTYVYAQETGTMAGIMTGLDGNRWTAIAQKGTWPSGIARSGAWLGAAAYSGRWQLDTDGVRGTLAIEANASGQITGTYTNASGTTVAVTGQVTADPRIFSLSIPNGASSTYYQGYLNGHALGIMSGAAVPGGTAVGFHATRFADL
ncbi:MAG: C1 family peptidase [Polyangiaceae bacterium]|nr:C1 family peptidase [Polyangiaceae bacterium]